MRITLAPFVLGFALPLTAFAGNDKARINEDGTVDFSVHYSYPPTEAEIENMESIIRLASVHFCDATDGQLRFGQVTIASTSSSEATADVWILPPGLWNRSNSTGFLLEDSARVFITPSGQNGPTFAHEMAHAALQLYDAYDEQARGGYSGIGWAIDPGVCSVSQLPCVVDGDCFPAESCDRTHLGNVPYVDDQANTVMSGVFALSLAPRCTDTTVNPPVESGFCLNGDIDCTAPAKCLPSPYYSEFLTEDFYDQFVGNDTGCPSVNPGTQIRFKGVLDQGSATPAFDGSSLVTALWSSEAKGILQLVDEDGDLSASWQGSDHRLGVFAQHVDDQTDAWTLHFLLDGRDIDGGTPGTAESIAEIEIDFNGPPIIDPYHGQLYGGIRVWDGQQFVSPGDQGYVAPVIQTFPFPNGASPLDLEIDLSGLYAVTGVDSNVLPTRVLGADDLPQTGSCQNSHPPDGQGGVMGFCDDNPATQCDGRWNSLSGRWEASHHTVYKLATESGYSSEWDVIADLPQVYGPNNVGAEVDRFNATINPPNGAPQAELGSCEDAGDEVEFDIRVDASDAIVFLVDTSGSMSEDLTEMGLTLTRLQWAKSAVGQIAMLVEDNNVNGTGPLQELGLVTFATEPDVLLELSPIGTGNQPDYLDVIDLLAPVPASGATALADGLAEAVDVAIASGAGSPSVVAFTDGHANVCLGGTPFGWDCSFQQASQDVIDVIADAAQGVPGVDFYFVPLGAETGAGVFGKAAGASGDIMIADTGFELPMAFLEAYLRSTGRAPITPRVSWAVAGNGRPTSLSQQYVLEVPVEVDAGALHVSLTSLNDELSTFAPTVSVRRPNGTLLLATEFSVEEDLEHNIYRTVLVEDPEPGVWQIEIVSATVVAQHGYALAWTDGQNADCYAGTASPLLNATVTEQEIRATASWDTPVEDVAYQATVKKPDGTLMTLIPEASASDGGMARAWLGAVDFQGLYRVEVQCDAQQARFVRGEDLQPGFFDVLSLFDETSSPAFVRTATTTFVVDNGQFQPLPAGNDCDGDGISNASEGAYCITGGSTGPCVLSTASRDTNGDGTVDACDEDSDSDEVLDRDEPTGDLDGDGLANVIDPDSDDDGIIDGLDDEPYVL